MSRILKYGWMVLIFPLTVLGQTGQFKEIRDFETWTSVAVKFKPNKQWTFGLQEQIRLDYNSTKVKGLFTQGSIGYKWFKGFETAFALRFIQVNDYEGTYQGWENHFRWHFDASYKHKIDRFSLKYRVRYQSKDELGLSKAEGDIAKKYWRFKVKAAYNIKNWKLDPFISGELFNHRENGVNYGFTDYRVTVGTSYNMKNAGKIGVYYRMEKEMNTSYPVTTNILRLKYTYTFKSKK